MGLDKIRHDVQTKLVTTLLSVLDIIYLSCFVAFNDLTLFCCYLRMFGDARIEYFWPHVLQYLQPEGR
jgi:hypothetical protein